jgi:GAF domain-containing protein
MESVLQELTDLARTVLAEDAEASITMVTDGRATTITYTGQLALDCDERQYETGHGPCLHAASTGDMVEISDTQLDPRWTDYACWAAERGALSSLSVPLPVSDRVSGALNVYSRRAEGFDEDSRAAATEFAPFGAVVLDNMSAYQDARVMVDKPAGRTGVPSGDRPGQGHPDGTPPPDRRAGVPVPDQGVVADEHETPAGGRAPG